MSSTPPDPFAPPDPEKQGGTGGWQPPAQPPTGAPLPPPYQVPGQTPPAGSPYGQPPAGQVRPGQPPQGPYGPYGQGPYGTSYPQTPYGAQPAYAVPSRARNSLGVWSLVLAVVSVVLCCGVFTAIPGIITGHLGLAAVRRGEADNRGVALAGTIISWVVTVLAILGTAFFLSSPEYLDELYDELSST